MHADNHSDPTVGDVITGAAGWAVALGILTMALFPFAVPGIVLAVAAVVPLLLLGLVLALAGAVLAGPVIAARALVRRRRARHADPAAHGGAGARTTPAAAALDA